MRIKLFCLMASVMAMAAPCLSAQTFTTLYSFTDGNDGGFPEAGFVLSGNTLYGTATGGGSSGFGTVFAINTDGTGFTNLYSFTDGTDGDRPQGGLILSGNTLYGTTFFGGASDAGGYIGYGTVFAVNTDGTGFTTLYSFTDGNDGRNPQGRLVLSGNTLCGIADGGSSGFGTIFSFALPPVTAPQLTIILSGSNVVLTWPTNAIGFTLQSTASLLSPAVWTSVSPGSVVVNGQNTVTNPVSGTQQFYQLRQ